MILHFKDAKTHEFWQYGTGSGVPADILRVAMRKLKQLDDAGSLEDMKVPPGNRLEALKGDRSGQFSIRINDKYRLCFSWEGGNAFNVEIVDYH